MPQIATLRWAIRPSFLDYLHALPDLDIRLDGATFDDNGFTFPSSGEPLAFTGRAEVTAHGGELHVVFADPVVEYHSGQALLVADTGSGHEALARLLDAPNLAEFARGGVAHDVALTIEGSVWLGAVYSPWARMDAVHLTSE